MAKKNHNLLYALVVLAVIGMMANQQGYFNNLGTLSVQPLDSSKIYLYPAIDTLKCELGEKQSLSLPYTVTGGIFGLFTERYYTDTCSQNVDLSGCDYEMTGTSISYRIKDSSGVCVAEEPLFEPLFGECNYRKVQNEASFLTITKTVKALPNNTIEIKTNNADAAKVVKSFTPYHLQYYRAGGGQSIWNAENCRLSQNNPDSNAISVDERSIIISSTSPKYTFIYKDPVPFTQSVGWVDTYFMTPVEANPILPNTQQQAACLLGNVYSIGDITLKGGTTYKTADKIIGTYGTVNQAGLPHYECCPNIKDNTKVCNSEWKYEDVATAQIQCNANTQCQTFQFGGGWNIDSTDITGQTWVRGACRNGLCDYRAEIKQVQCSYNGMCPADQVCDTNGNCIASKGVIISNTNQSEGAGTNLGAYGGGQPDWLKNLGAWFKELLNGFGISLGNLDLASIGMLFLAVVVIALFVVYRIKNPKKSGGGSGGTNIINVIR